MNKKPFATAWQFLTLCFVALVGRFSWNSPPWFDVLRQKMREHARLAWGMLAGILLIGYGYHWYTHLPHPPRVTAIITTPKITPVAKKLIPDVLMIDFGINKNGFTIKSVAPLKQIGKEITDGITLSPAMPGKWIWQSDSRMVFTPNNDWPAGETYSIHFAQSVFAYKTKLESLDYSFKTLPFQGTIAEFKFYQDPVNPKIHQAVATISFNYPVDSSSFEKNTELLLQAIKNDKLNLGAEHFKFNVTYDENKRNAYLHSEPLPLPETSRYLQLMINKGVNPIYGPGHTQENLTQSVLVPDAASYFKISRVDSSIVRNDQNRPEQVLTLETTLGVSDAELNKSLHVYLLPKDYPASSTEEAKLNYTWQNPGEVTDNILKLATPVVLQPIPADRDYATLHSYRFAAQSARFLYIKCDKGIRSFGDYVLADPFASVVKVPEYPKEISFLHKGALLALSGEKKLSVLIRGVPAVKFQIARVLPNNINQLITQSQGDFDDPHFINTSFNQDNISEIFSEIQAFNNTDLARANYTALDIGKYLSLKTNTGGPQGLFLLQATGWDTEKKAPLDVSGSRLILVTDLGLITKDNHDGSHDVYVQSITTGTPVANASISILGKNGLPLYTKLSDSTGHVNFPSLKDFLNEREPAVYLASLGNDVSFIPYNNSDRQLNFSRFDIGGIYTNPELQRLNAYVFSDRGIYRPGDTAHVGMIIKQAYANAAPSGLPLEVIVTDPRGTNLQDQKFTLDPTGFFTFDFKTFDTFPTGQYVINLYIVKDNHPSSLLGSTTLRVAEFLPDRMRITAHLSKEQAQGWIAPQDLSATVGLWNLYGAPATDRKISAKILLAPQRIQFNEYPNFIFMDPLFDPNKPAKVFTDTLTDAHTDAKGLAQFNLNLERFDKATYELTFFTEGFEAEGGRSVTTQTTALVSPLPYFVGYKTNGPLNYIKQDNNDRQVNVIAINPQLQMQPVSNLKIQRAILHPVTTLVKKPDGTFQYQSLIQTSVIDTKPFSIALKGTQYTLPTDKIGDFLVTVLDEKNQELSKFQYSVVGNSQLPLAKNAELTTKLNQAEYQPGDTIELQITAPYTGGGLITLERDKVYAAQWFKTNTTSSVQHITIPKDFQGNGYVNVAFVRDWDSPEIFISPLSYSVTPFSVTHQEHRININLTTPDLARPGEPFVIHYQSDKPGKMIVFAVDEGILQVANYKSPDPLGFFFQKHALEVITQQTLDQILPKFIQDRELSAVGGDGGEAALQKHLNPFKRKTDLPVVYWSGIVDTDSTVRQLVYQVPDYFNGTLRVMAVAVAADAMGAASKTAQIRGDFVINPNVPTFVAPQDEFEITASVANNVKGSGNDAKINVLINTTAQLEIIGSSEQSLVISENQEKTVKFKLRAKSTLSGAQINFIASLGNKISKMSATLSVRPANHYFTTIQSGSTNSDKTLVLDRKLYPEYRTVEAVASSSPLILVAGLQRYLNNFPYGCTEQLVSKSFPLVATKQGADNIQATIQMLGQRQMSSGGFSYWPNVGDNDNNAFASVYAMHFLTEAREAGYNVPNEMLRAGLGYLKELAAQNPTSLDQARIQAYAIYILTRNEIVTTNYLTNLQLFLEQDTKQTWHRDITSAYMAATYQLLKSTATAERMIDYYQLGTSAAFADDFYNTQIADAEYLYLTARHFPDRFNKISNKAVMSLVAALNSDQINTVLSSYASLALNAYGQTLDSTTHATFSINEILQNGKQQTLAAPDSAYAKVSADLLAEKILFSPSQKQIYFYQLTQTGFDTTLPTEVVKNNLEIEREYRNTQGKVITTAQLGDEIEVHIRVRALDKDYLSNIAIVDLLPGGFEVVRDSIKSANVEFVDAREDRVIFFTGVDAESKEIVYRIKATNTGQFTVPAIFAASMYNPNVSAHNVAGKITVGS